MGHSSAVVTAVTPVRQPSGPGALRDLILRAVRAAFTRLGAADVRNRLKSVKSKVNVQVASAQRALMSNKLEPPVKTRVSGRDLRIRLRPGNSLHAYDIPDPAAGTRGKNGRRPDHDRDDDPDPASRSACRELATGIM